MSTTKPPGSGSPPISAAPGVTISDKAAFTGSHPVTIGPQTIIHPFARIDASYGPVHIEEGVVIWERAVVGTRLSQKPHLPDDQDLPEKSTKIGSHVQLQASSHIGAFASVGAHTSVGVAVRVGDLAQIGAWATLSPCISIPDEDIVDDWTTVFLHGDAPLRRVNVPVRDDEQVRKLKQLAKDKEVKMLGRLIKGGSKWTTT